MKWALTILISTCLSAWASDPVDQSRLPFQGSWNGIVGVSNGIPNRQTINTTLGPSATVDQINSAIASCTSNQVVSVTAGSYTLSGANLNIANNGVTLRGDTNASGIPTTIFVFDSTHNTVMQNAAWNADNPPDFSNITISSGDTRGSTSVVLSATPTGLLPGTLMCISTPRNAPTIDGNPSSFFANWFGSSDNHPMAVFYKVTNVSGNTVSFWPPINSDYISSLACKVHFRTFDKQLVLSGIENIIFTNTAGVFAKDIISQQGNDQCWLKNCIFYGVGNGSSANGAVHGYCCFHNEIRHCYTSIMASYQASEYAMVTFYCSGWWVEDNWGFQLANYWPQVCTSDCAFTYNYFTNVQYNVSPTFLSQMEFNHGAHNSYNLNEGNWIPTHFSDLTGSGNFSHSRNTTYFRERLAGWDGNGPKTVNAHGISFQNHHDNATVADCNLGTSGIQTQYEQTTGASGGTDSCFNYDSAVSGTTLQRFGNWNIVDGGVHPAEQLSGNQAFVNSYIYATKPSNFGILPWPPNPAAGTATLIDPTNIPAGYRFVFGVDPPQPPTAPGSTTTFSSGTIQSGSGTITIQ